MCGIAGFLDVARAGDEAWLGAHARAMGDALAHRGPDHGAIHVDAGAGVGLAHRRLAIVDLSPAGEQPMVSADGRFVMVYNGEVYNAADLRPDLPGIAWRGYSDTEVMLEACARWGVAEACKRFIGMFAFALWDRKERTLHLVRDRLGIKPLFWTHQHGRFAFASELKALHVLPAISLEIDRAVLPAYMRFGYVPAPRSIYAGVQKLMPGHVLTLPWGGEATATPFWSLEAVVEQARSQTPADLDDRHATDALEVLLMDAVGRRMVADVPLGAFLSGGVDSSTVTALMQAQSARPVKTFSIGFSEGAYDEAPFARDVAKHLKTEHTEFYVGDADALGVIPDLPTWFDEPFADPSQIPTYLVSALARKHVTVSLSGDGGDELFAGYSRHVFAAGAWQQLQRLPAGLRSAAAAGIKAVPPGAIDQLLSYVPASRRPAMGGDRAHKLADLLAARDDAGLYRGLVSQWAEPGRLVRGETDPAGSYTDTLAPSCLQDAAERMQYADTLTYLPDDVLAKVDRASMAVALEARVPLLDHRVVQFAWSLPMRHKIRDGRGKWLLREVLARHVPRSLTDRPKAGFGVPLEHWLRGPLRDWAQDLLDPARMSQDGYLNPEPIQAAWAEHQSGRRNRQYQLWTVLMFQAWLRRWGGARSERKTCLKSIHAVV